MTEPTAQPGAERTEIRTGFVLPAKRENIEMVTPDGLTLVGELALPPEGEPVATLVTFHPLPTDGGFMDSHIYRKASYRLPALAQIAVLRFNTRGTSSDRGTSEGQFDGGVAERYDVAAAMAFADDMDLPNPWYVGWSFGTELGILYARDYREHLAGVILLSPPLHRAGTDDLAKWRDFDKPFVWLVPEHDDYLQPDAAKRAIEEAGLRVGGPDDRQPGTVDFVPVEEGKHLWVGEPQVRRVLNEIVARVNPSAAPLPTHWPVD